MIIPVPAIIERDLFDRTRAQLATNYALCTEKQEEFISARRKDPVRVRAHQKRGRSAQGQAPLLQMHRQSLAIPPAARMQGTGAQREDRR